ncbi:MAG: hypothetical protein E5W53_14520, partial [Mesorhizobium sp.]
RIEHAGIDAHVFVDAEAGAQFVARISAERARSLRDGDNLGLTIDAEKAWFFPSNGSRQRGDHSGAA